MNAHAVFKQADVILAVLKIHPCMQKWSLMLSLITIVLQKGTSVQTCTYDKVLLLSCSRKVKIRKEFEFKELGL